MLIHVHCKPFAKKSSISQDTLLDGKTIYTISTKAPAIDGQANQECIALLSDYFHIPKSRIRIIK